MQPKIYITTGVYFLTDQGTWTTDRNKAQVFSLLSVAQLTLNEMKPLCGIPPYIETVQ